MNELEHDSKATRDHDTSVKVEVNDQPVTLLSRAVTGAQIKAAAIAQHVDIKANFQLIRKRPGQASKVIGDDELVHIHEHEKFRAIPPDDNS